MTAPAASTLPSVVRRKAVLAVHRHPGHWDDPRFESDLYVEAKVSLLTSIRECWWTYRHFPRSEQRPRLRDVIRLKITAYRFFDSRLLANHT